MKTFNEDKFSLFKLFIKLSLLVISFSKKEVLINVNKLLILDKSSLIAGNNFI